MRGGEGEVWDASLCKRKRRIAAVLEVFIPRQAVREEMTMRLLVCGGGKEGK